MYLAGCPADIFSDARGELKIAKRMIMCGQYVFNVQRGLYQRVGNCGTHQNDSNYDRHLKIAAKRVANCLPERFKSLIEKSERKARRDMLAIAKSASSERLMRSDELNDKGCYQHAIKGEPDESTYISQFSFGTIDATRANAVIAAGIGPLQLNRTEFFLFPPIEPWQ